AWPSPLCAVILVFLNRFNPLAGVPMSRRSLAALAGSMLVCLLAGPPRPPEAAFIPQPGVIFCRHAGTALTLDLFTPMDHAQERRQRRGRHLGGERRLLLCA